MLVPLTRQKFEQLIPLLATGAQYGYYWGKFPDFLKRLLISVVGAVVVFFIELALGRGWGPILFLMGLIASLYWLWAPIYIATVRNSKHRRYTYSGFWRGEVLDSYITEELIGEEQTVNNRGELVIIENRERRLTIVVGDETGFTSEQVVPLRRTYKAIRPGQTAEMLLLSNQKDLGRIALETDIYISDLDLWVSDYPYVRRDMFADVSRQLRSADYEETDYPRRSSKSNRPSSADYEETDYPRRSSKSNRSSSADYEETDYPRRSSKSNRSSSSADYEDEETDYPRRSSKSNRSSSADYEDRDEPRRTSRPKRRPPF